MRESFVIHAEYIEDLPEEYKDRFLKMVYDYGIFETVPALKGLEKSLWIKIQRRIDLDREAYNKRLEYLKEYRKNKKSANCSQRSESSQTFADNTESFANIQTISRSDTDIDIDIVNDIDIDTDIVSVSDIDAPAQMPSPITEPVKNFSNQIFNIFKDAGLPCSKGNEISFLQTDFKNALAFIRKSDELKNFNSQDILEACKNYVSVLKDESTYVTSKMNFFSLAKSKMFYNLMPGNFDKESFKKFESSESKNEEKEKPEKKVFSPKPCPSCGKNHVYWSQKKEMYVCDDCSKTFDFDQYLGEI